MGNSLSYLKKMELRNFELKFPTKNFYPQINLQFFYTYMWCYQYTGTKLIQNFGSLYIYQICTHCGIPHEHLTN